MLLGNLRLGVSGPGEIGKTSLLKELLSYLRKLGFQILIVDTDLHNSLSSYLSAPTGLVPWSSREGALGLLEVKNSLKVETPESIRFKKFSFLRTPILKVGSPLLQPLGLELRVSSGVAGTRWIDLAKMVSPPRIQLADLPADLIHYTEWGAIIRTYPLEANPSPMCDHGRLNPLQTILSLLELPDNWVMFVDLPGGERSLSWAWGALALNAVILLHKIENQKHDTELGLLQGYCRDYDLKNVELLVDGVSVQVQEGKMTIEESTLHTLLQKLTGFATDEVRFLRNSELVLR